MSSGGGAAELEVLAAAVRLFFDRITAERWASITHGCPDDSAKMLLADLILEMIGSATWRRTQRHGRRWWPRWTSRFERV